MTGECFKGDIKDVCAELRSEAKSRKGMMVGAWLKMRELERVEANQFGMDVDEYRKCINVKGG